MASYDHFVLLTFRLILICVEFNWKFDIHSHPCWPQAHTKHAGPSMQPVTATCALTGCSWIISTKHRRGGNAHNFPLSHSASISLPISSSPPLSLSLSLPQSLSLSRHLNNLPISAPMNYCNHPGFITFSGFVSGMSQIWSDVPEIRIVCTATSRSSMRLNIGQSNVAEMRREAAEVFRHFLKIVNNWFCI